MMEGDEKRVLQMFVECTPKKGNEELHNLPKPQFMRFLLVI